MTTPTTSTEILHHLRAKRELSGPVLHLKDYWRTYGLMVLYGAGLLLFFNEITDARWLALLVFFATTALVSAAIRDTRRVINRRFELLVELLEKRGAL